MSATIWNGESRSLSIDTGKKLSVVSMSGTYSVLTTAGAGAGTALATNATGGTYGPYAGPITVLLSSSALSEIDYDVAVTPVIESDTFVKASKNLTGGLEILANGRPIPNDDVSYRHELKSPTARRLLRVQGAASFSLSGDAGLIVADSAKMYNGFSTVGMTTNSGIGGSITKLLAIPADISVGDGITIAYWIPNTIPNSGTITVYLASDAVLNTLTNRVQGVFFLGGVAKPGWNTFTLLKSELTTSGAPDLTSIKQVRIRIDQSSGAAYEAVFAELLFGYAHRPTITLMCDDGYTEQYAKSGLTVTSEGMDGGFYSYLKSKKIPGSIAVIGSRVGTTGFITDAMLSEMYGNGFDLVVHGDLNLITGYTTDSDRFADIEKNRSALLSRGFTRGANAYVYPEGAYSIGVENYLSSAGFDVARTLFGPTILSAVTQNCAPYVHQPMALHSVTMGNQTFATIKPIIDRAVALGHSLVIYGHKLITGLPAGDIMLTTYSEFTQIADYCAQLAEAGKADLVDYSTLGKMIQRCMFSRQAAAII